MSANAGDSGVINEMGRVNRFDSYHQRRSLVLTLFKRFPTLVLGCMNSRADNILRVSHNLRDSGESETKVTISENYTCIKYCKTPARQSKRKIALQEVGRKPHRNTYCQ